MLKMDAVYEAVYVSIVLLLCQGCWLGSQSFLSFHYTDKT